MMSMYAHDVQSSEAMLYSPQSSVPVMTYIATLHVQYIYVWE